MGKAKMISGFNLGWYALFCHRTWQKDLVWLCLPSTPKAHPVATCLHFHPRKWFDRWQGWNASFAGAPHPFLMTRSRCRNQCNHRVHHPTSFSCLLFILTHVIKLHNPFERRVGKEPISIDVYHGGIVYCPKIGFFAIRPQILSTMRL